MVKEEEKKSKEDVAQNIRTKADNDPIRTENEIVQKRTETALVVNPTSSGGSTGKDWETQFARIKEVFGEHPELVFTEKSGDGTTLTRELLKKGFKKIVAIGGDGTINEVVNGFFVKEEANGSMSFSHRTDSSSNTQQKKEKKQKSKDKYRYNSNFPGPDLIKPVNAEAIMGLIPSGTRNVLAKSLNFPEEIMDCCHNFVNNKVQKIDVITATVTEPADHTKTLTRVFLNAAEIGFGAEVIDRSKKVRGKIRSRIISTITSIFATLPTYESNMCEVTIDDGREKVLTKMTMGIIANGKFLGGGFKAAPHANVSDGLLDAIILKDSGSLKMIDELANIRTGDYSNETDVFYKQVKKISIKSKERNVTVAIDGEPIGILPATFQVNHNALNIIM